MRDHVWTGASDGGSLARAIEQRVALVDHDPRWGARFDAERARLTALVPGAFVEIVHIGSTRVEDLCAKPIVDLMAGVRSMDDAVALGGPLLKDGYAMSTEFNRSLVDWQFFMRHAGGLRTHHLHVVVHDSPSWHDRIDFCRRLRDDADLRQRYAALKTLLVARHAEERERYTEGKSTFILAALRERDA